MHTMAKEKQKKFLITILKDSWALTWAHKAWWFFGFVALFLTGSIGYQLIFQGAQSLIEPGTWWERWQVWAQGVSPIDFATGQFQILFSDPKGWLAAVFVWTVILLVLLLLFWIAVYSTTMLVSAAKLKQINGSESILLALSEAWLHVKSVFGLVILIQLVSNALILVFSIPVIWFGIAKAGTWSTIFLFLFFFLFLICAFIVTMVSIYSIQYIIMEDDSVSEAVVSGWRLLRKHWVISLEMLLLQLIVVILVAAATLIVVSLITIPVIIIGFFLVSQQIFDLTVFLPKLILYLLSIILFVVGAAYNVFQLYNWSFLFMRFDEIHPKSRIAIFIEEQLFHS